MLRRRPRRPTERAEGRPTSSNGASSLHVWWEPTTTATTTVSATLEIVEPPTVDHLYFWALQATFVDDDGRPIGTAHLGLQWYAAHPGHTAVNWGGYKPNGAGELTDLGPPSELPSATGNPNTRDFAWRPRVPYRLTIDVDGTGSIAVAPNDEDRRTSRVVVRKLAVDGAARLTNPVVWSEVFARCDDPPTTVRWSDLHPSPSSLHATYQSFAAGGCTNTDTTFDATVGTLTQRTNCERTTPEGRLA